MATMTSRRATANRLGFDVGNSPVNVGELGRWVSVFGGGALAAAGLARRSPLGALLAIAGGSLIYRGLTGFCTFNDALGISTARRTNRNVAIPAGAGCKVEQIITVQRSPAEVYEFWRELENLPRIMRHLDSVRVLDGRRSHWVARAPLGLNVQWDAEIITDRPNETISWRSVPGSMVSTAGSVHFTPAAGGQGTQVRVILKFDPPAGKLGARIARLLGESPDTQIAEDLQHFKQIMESRRVPTAV